MLKQEDFSYKTNIVRFVVIYKLVEYIKLLKFRKWDFVLSHFHFISYFNVFTFKENTKVTY